MVNRSGSTKRRLNETQHRQSKTHKMGMQISCGIHPEVSQEKYLRVGEKRARADHSGFSPAEGEYGGGGASDGRIMCTCCYRYHRSTRSQGWWGSLRARVPSQ